MSRQGHRPQGFKRTDRIADFIQRELALLISREVKDPRLGMVTIQDVKVSSDLSYAEVYFTLLGEDISASSEAEEVLAHASGYLRSSLAKSLNTRKTPRLRFHYDTLPEHASHMEGLLRKVHQEDGERDPAADTDTTSSEEN